MTRLRLFGAAVVWFGTMTATRAAVACGTVETTPARGRTSGSIVSGGSGAAGSTSSGGNRVVGADCRGSSWGGSGGLGVVYGRTRAGGLDNAGAISGMTGNGALRSRRRPS